MRSSWMLWMTSIMHLSWGVIAILQPDVALAQSTVAQLHRAFHGYLSMQAVGVVFVALAVLAMGSLWRTTGEDKPDLGCALLLLPQQGVMVWITFGLGFRYFWPPEGTTPNPFGFLNSINLAVFHAAALIAYLTEGSWSALFRTLWPPWFRRSWRSWFRSRPT